MTKYCNKKQLLLGYADSRIFIFGLVAVVSVIFTAGISQGKAPAERSRYAAIDAHVIRTPKRAEKSIKDLAAYLAKPSRNDKEKVRAIFSWVAMNIKYDVVGFKSKKYGDLSADGVLKSRKAVCSGYARLFQRLAAAVGLESVIINGYSKGYGYATGAGFKATNHAWNAVKIGKKWYLLDTTWGAGYLDEKSRFVRRYNDHFFLTPPEKFIYDHFPADKRWQLLARPVSMSQYQDFVYLKPTFFNTGLAIESHKESTITTGNNLNVTIGAPPEALLLAVLIEKGKKLDGAYTFLQRNGKNYSVHAIFPAPGTYTLRIFAKTKGDKDKYEWALDYKVLAKKSSKPPHGFPTIFAEFGEKNTFLFEPLQRNLKAGPRHFFKLRSPGAVEVVVKNGDTWHDLKKNKDMFSGSVPIQKGKVEVYAKYTGDDRYRGLLLYKGY